MEKRSATSLQAAIMLVSMSTLAFLLWEPHIEGRNAHATLFEIYFKDPFLAYAYFASVPFFVALYQAFKISGYAKQGKASSLETLKALQTIKRCAMSLIVFAAIGEVFIILNESDDRVGGFFMSTLVILGSIAITAVVNKLERILQNTTDTKD